MNTILTSNAVVRKIWAVLMVLAMLATNLAFVTPAFAEEVADTADDTVVTETTTEEVVQEVIVVDDSAAGGDDSNGNPGAVWTTSATCDVDQNLNEYTVGETVYLNGANFDANAEYEWVVKDPGNGGAVIVSGTVTTDADGDACLEALVLAPEHVGGPYQAQIGKKNDNFSVVAAEDEEDTDDEGGDDTTPSKTFETIVVSSDTSAAYGQEGWLFNRDERTATPFEFNSDTSSIGDGALYVEPIINDYTGVCSGSGSTAQPNCDKFIAEYFTGNMLVSDFVGLSYDFVIAGDGAETDAGEFYVNLHANFPGNEGAYGNCKYDYVPTTGTVGDFTTYSFDATDTPNRVRGTDCPATLAEMPAGSTIFFFALNLGDTSASDEGLGGYFDNVILDTVSKETTFDFEPGPVDPENKNALNIRAYKFNNLDGDRAKEDGEPNLPGWKLRVYEETTDGWVMIDEKVTDENGEAKFRVTEAGTYHICEVAQLGWTQVRQDWGGTTSHVITDNMSPNAAEEGPYCATKVYTDEKGKSTVSYLGNIENDPNDEHHYNQIGIKFNNLNGDRDRDDGEEVLSGWEMNFYKETETGWEFIATTTTAENGKYSFPMQYEAGVYHVCEVMQEGWEQVRQDWSGTPYHIITDNMSPNAAIEGPYCSTTVFTDEADKSNAKYFGNMRKDVTPDPEICYADYEVVFTDESDVQAVSATGGPQTFTITEIEGGYEISLNGQDKNNWLNAAGTITFPGLNVEDFVFTEATTGTNGNDGLELPPDTRPNLDAISFSGDTITFDFNTLEANDTFTIMHESLVDCDEPEPTTVDVKICKVDQKEQPLDGWQLSLIGEKVDSLAFKVDGTVQKFANVPTGNYVMTADGTYKYRGGTALLADARFSERKAGDLGYGTYPYQPWKVANPATGGLSVAVNGDNGALWGEVFNPAHKYYGAVTQTTASDIMLTMYDNYYKDNKGTLNLALYRGYTGVTGDDGCVVFKNVPTGEYDIEELLQIGWTNVSGLGPVEVTPEQTTFVVMNTDGTPTEPDPEYCSLAGKIVEATKNPLQNDGDPVENNRRTESSLETVAPYMNPTGKDGTAYNPADFFSLGIEGFLTYQFTDKVAVNKPGPDIAIYEITGGTPGAPSDESVKVEVSEDGVTYVDTGVHLGDVYIDIDGYGLDFVKYVRLTDQSKGVQGNNGDGYDVDAIVILDDSCADKPPVEICEIGFTVDFGDDTTVGGYETTGTTAGAFTIREIPGGYEVALRENVGNNNRVAADGVIIFSNANLSGATITKSTGNDKFEDGSGATELDEAYISGNNVVFNLQVTTANDVFTITGIKKDCEVPPIDPCDIIPNLQALTVVSEDDDCGEPTPEMCYLTYTAVTFDAESDITTRIEGDPSEVPAGGGVLILDQTEDEFTIAFMHRTDKELYRAKGTITFPAGTDLSGFTQSDLAPYSGLETDGEYKDTLIVSGNTIVFDLWISSGDDVQVITHDSFYDEANCPSTDGGDSTGGGGSVTYGGGGSSDKKGRVAGDSITLEDVLEELRKRLTEKFGVGGSILGDQVSIIPVGGADAGAGSTAPVAVPTPYATNLALISNRRDA